MTRFSTFDDSDATFVAPLRRSRKARVNQVFAQMIGWANNAHIQCMADGEKGVCSTGVCGRDVCAVSDIDV